jgi:drug/metabolite transporter (DMT)-like permease
MCFIVGVGEAANFAAFGFVPASLVTPLGALSVIVSAVLSSYLLNENLNLHGKLGCVLSLLGSTIVVLHAPEEAMPKDLDEIAGNMLNISFIIYSTIALSISVYLIFCVAPVYGQTNILVYISICSFIGSLTVVACKGLSIAIKLTISGNNQLTNPLAWFILLAVVFTITLQLNYLNKSLDSFNTSLVTPIYYVMFTTLTVTSSAILFKEWAALTPKDMIGLPCAFVTIICGVFLLHTFKDINFTLQDLLSLTSKVNSFPNMDHQHSTSGGITIILDNNSNSRHVPSQGWSDNEFGNEIEILGDEENFSETNQFLGTR